MSLTIEQIKKYCISIDVENINFNNSVAININGVHTELTNKKEVEIFYSSIKLKELLSIYSNYNGLECLERDGESLEKHGYTLDILSLIESL